jgi:hypothetical protein
MKITNKRPHGRRIFAEVAITPKIKYIARVKAGTATLLGLKGVAKLPIVKTRHTKGWKGTRSYILLLKKLTDVGGFPAASVSIPVAPTVKFEDFYAWAYKNSILAGITTPWGITYAWDTPAETAVSDEELSNALAGYGSDLPQLLM